MAEITAEIQASAAVNAEIDCFPIRYVDCEDFEDTVADAVTDYLDENPPAGVDRYNKTEIDAKLDGKLDTTDYIYSDDGKKLDVNSLAATGQIYAQGKITSGNDVLAGTTSLTETAEALAGKLDKTDDIYESSNGKTLNADKLAANQIMAATKFVTTAGDYEIGLNGEISLKKTTTSVSELKSDLVNLTKTVVTTYVNGSLDKNGVIITGSNKVTDYIDCSSFGSISLLTTGGNYCAFYDSNKSLIKSILFIDSYLTLDVPTNAVYFRATRSSWEASNSPIIGNFRIKYNSDKIDRLFNICGNDILCGYKMNYGLVREQSDGSAGVEHMDNYYYSDFIPVDKYVYYPSGNGSFITWYHDKTFESFVGQNISNINGTVKPNNANYMVVSYNSSNDFTISDIRNPHIDFAKESYNALKNVNKKYYVEKDGSGDFTRLIDAIYEAERYMDSVVYLGSGTWDLIDELGSEYIESISGSNRGLYLKNRIHIIGSSRSVIQCHYTGNNSTVINWLSAFNAGDYGFTLENLTISTRKCRYTIHDEMDYHEIPYTNKYINCHFIHDNQAGGYQQCIGGGLGRNGYIIIDGCTFENSNINNNCIVSYHNTWYGDWDCKSNIEVNNNLCKGLTTFKFSWFGSATKKTTINCSNNSLGADIIFCQETTDTSLGVPIDIVNMELNEWNNVVRNS